MNRMNPKRLAVFFSVFAAIAIVISALQGAKEQQRAVENAKQQRAMANQMAAQKAAQDEAMAKAKVAQEAAAKEAKAAQDAAAKQAQAARDAEMARARAAQEAALKHAQFLARYLNAGLPPKRDMRTVAIVVATEDKVLNRAVTEALARHFKTGNVEIYSSFFNPVFVSDSLFDDLLAGSGDILNTLELAKSLDELLLARQEVRYTSNPSLENVVTVTMKLNVVALPIAGNDDPKKWTFTAVGSGFKQQDARTMAEERLIKQIDTDTNMTLNLTN
jgi:hypothetical protein